LPGFAVERDQTAMAPISRSSDVLLAILHNSHNSVLIHTTRKQRSREENTVFTSEISRLCIDGTPFRQSSGCDVYFSALY
jgi:hypothetical protein